MEAETPMVEPTPRVPGLRQRGVGGGSQNTVLLGPRDSLNGTLKVDGEVRVQGTVEGELHATGDVHVEGSANVKAAIDARNVTVRGTVTGDVTAKEKLVLVGSGALIGNVKVVRLSIEDGATLNGNVTMSGVGRETRHEDKTEENKEGG